MKDGAKCPASKCHAHIEVCMGCGLRNTCEAFKTLMDRLARKLKNG